MWVFKCVVMLYKLNIKNIYIYKIEINKIIYIYKYAIWNIQNIIKIKHKCYYSYI